MLIKAPSYKDVSRQLWSMLNPFVKESTVASLFANVPRHNGLEAWRRIARPIHEDKLLLQKDLLVHVNSPKKAASNGNVEQAIEDWDTSIRLYEKACGSRPLCSESRMTLMQIIPRSVAGTLRNAS